MLTHVQLGVHLGCSWISCVELLFFSGFPPQTASSPKGAVRGWDLRRKKNREAKAESGSNPLGGLAQWLSPNASFLFQTKCGDSESMMFRVLECVVPHPTGRGC